MPEVTDEFLVAVKEALSLASKMIRASASQLRELKFENKMMLDQLQKIDNAKQCEVKR